jgi:hypothetical protein
MAVLLTSFAILAKAPAAHIGIAFGLLAVWRKGVVVLKRRSLWTFAVVSLIAPALWYARAHEFWLVYGNSLGASNHHHLVGLAALTNPGYVQGILDLDVHFIWSLSALLAVALAVALGPRLRGLGYGLLWYAAVLIYFLVIAGTSAYQWGTYYHIVALPPVALLVGWTAAVVARRFNDLEPGNRWRAAIVLVIIAATSVVANRFVDGGARIVFFVAAGAAAVFARKWPRVSITELRAPQTFATGALACLLCIGFVSILKITAAERHPAQSVEEFQTARVFAPLIPPGVLIGASGGYCVSATESAYERPWYFYWTDHKGFSRCVQASTVPELQRLVLRGVHYYIVERWVFAWEPGLEDAMRREFTVLAETPQAVLFRL